MLMKARHFRFKMADIINNILKILIIHSCLFVLTYEIRPVTSAFSSKSADFDIKHNDAEVPPRHSDWYRRNAVLRKRKRKTSPHQPHNFQPYDEVKEISGRAHRKVRRPRPPTDKELEAILGRRLRPSEGVGKRIKPYKSKPLLAPNVGVGKRIKPYKSKPLLAPNVVAKFNNNQDQCGFKPCQNNGVCRMNPDSKEGEFQCACPLGFRGTLCEDDMARCDKVECKSVKDCIITPEGAICVCMKGISGRLCQMKLEKVTQWDKLRTVISDQTIKTGEQVMACLLGIIALISLFMTIHFCRVRGKRREIREKYANILSEGKVPTDLPPDWWDISNNLCKQAFCCGSKSKLNVEFSPQKSSSRLKTEESLEKLLNSKTNLRSKTSIGRMNRGSRSDITNRRSTSNVRTEDLGVGGVRHVSYHLTQNDMPPPHSDDILSNQSGSDDSADDKPRIADVSHNASVDKSIEHRRAYPHSRRQSSTSRRESRAEASRKQAKNPSEISQKMGQPKSRVINPIMKLHRSFKDKTNTGIGKTKNGSANLSAKIAALRLKQCQSKDVHNMGKNRAVYHKYNSNSSEDLICNDSRYNLGVKGLKNTSIGNQPYWNTNMNMNTDYEGDDVAINIKKENTPNTLDTLPGIKGIFSKHLGGHYQYKSLMSRPHYSHEVNRENRGPLDHHTDVFENTSTTFGSPSKQSPWRFMTDVDKNNHQYREHDEVNHEMEGPFDHTDGFENSSTIFDSPRKQATSRFMAVLDKNNHQYREYDEVNHEIHGPFDHTDGFENASTTFDSPRKQATSRFMAGLDKNNHQYREYDEVNHEIRGPFDHTDGFENASTTFDSPRKQATSRFMAGLDKNNHQYREYDEVNHEIRGPFDHTDGFENTSTEFHHPNKQSPSRFMSAVDKNNHQYREHDEVNHEIHGPFDRTDGFENAYTTFDSQRKQATSRFMAGLDKNNHQYREYDEVNHEIHGPFDHTDGFENASTTFDSPSKQATSMFMAGLDKNNHQYREYDEVNHEIRGPFDHTDGFKNASTPSHSPNKQATSRFMAGLDTNNHQYREYDAESINNYHQQPEIKRSDGRDLKGEATYLHTNEDGQLDSAIYGIFSTTVTLPNCNELDLPNINEHDASLPYHNDSAENADTVSHRDEKQMKLADGDTVAHRDEKQMKLADGDTVAHRDEKKMKFADGDTVAHRDEKQMKLADGDTVAHRDEKQMKLADGDVCSDVRLPEEVDFQYVRSFEKNGQTLYFVRREKHVDMDHGNTIPDDEIEVIPDGRGSVSVVSVIKPSELDDINDNSDFTEYFMMNMSDERSKTIVGENIPEELIDPKRHNTL